MLFKSDRSAQPQIGVFVETKDAFAREQASKPTDGQLLLKLSVHSPMNKKATGQATQLHFNLEKRYGGALTPERRSPISTGRRSSSTNKSAASEKDAVHEMRAVFNSDQK